MKMKRLLALLICISVTFSAAVISSAADTSYLPTGITAVINGDAATSRGVNWFTVSDCGSVVRCRIKDESGSLKEFIGTSSYFFGKYRHAVLIDGLEPGKTYVYVVGDPDKNVWSPECMFKTDDLDNSFSFIVTADPQASSDENFKKSAFVMQQAVKTLPGADFFVDLGDYVNDCTMEEWDYYFDNFAPYNQSLTHVPVAGNHDGNLRWNFFKTMFNVSTAGNWQSLTGAYYAFDWGDAHFAVLNTNDMYPMQLEQINWLRNTMNTTEKQWKIVLMHRSLYSAGKNINKPDTIAMRQTLIPIMDELGIDIVLSGHDHMYYRSKQLKNDSVVTGVRYVDETVDGEKVQCALDPDGTVYIVADTIGTKRYYVHEDAIDPILSVAAVASQPDQTKGNDDPDGYRCALFMTVEFSDGAVLLKAYTVEDDSGETLLFDSYMIRKTSKETPDPDYVPLPEDSISNSDANVSNFFTVIIRMLIDYLTKLLPKFIKGAVS